MYAITHEGKAYGPSGIITDTDGVPLKAEDSEAYNKAVEVAELEHLKSHPDKTVLYVEQLQGVVGYLSPWRIITWRGVVLDGCAYVGPRRHIGWGSNTYRRAVTCRIFGVLYHGWYMESTGGYCRLRKAKRQ